MSNPVLTVSSSNLNTLAGTKRSFAGDAASLPQWLPAKRGRAVEPPGAEVTVPGLSARDRPNRGTNITIPYARNVPVSAYAHERGRVEPGDVVFTDVGPDTLQLPDTGAGVKMLGSNAFCAVLGIDRVNAMLLEASRKGMKAFNKDQLGRIRGAGVHRERWDGPQLQRHEAGDLDATKEHFAEELRQETAAKTVRDAFDELDSDNRAVDTQEGDTVDLSVLRRVQLDGVVLSHDEREARTVSRDELAVYNVAVQGRAQLNNGFAIYERYDKPWVESRVRAAAPTSDMMKVYHNTARHHVGDMDIGRMAYEFTPTQMFDRELMVDDVLYVGLFQAEAGRASDLDGDGDASTSKPREEHGVLYFKCFSGRVLEVMMKERVNLRRAVSSSSTDINDPSLYPTDPEADPALDLGTPSLTPAAAGARVDPMDIDLGTRTGRVADPSLIRVDRDAFERRSRPTRSDEYDRGEKRTLFDPITSVGELESLVVAWPVGRVLDNAAVRTGDGAVAATLHVCVGKMRTAAQLGVSPMSPAADGNLSDLQQFVRRSATAHAQLSQQRANRGRQLVSELADALHKVQSGASEAVKAAAVVAEAAIEAVRLAQAEAQAQADEVAIARAAQQAVRQAIKSVLEEVRKEQASAESTDSAAALAHLAAQHEAALAQLAEQKKELARGQERIAAAEAKYALLLTETERRSADAAEHTALAIATSVVDDDAETTVSSIFKDRMRPHLLTVLQMTGQLLTDDVIVTTVLSDDSLKAWVKEVFSKLLETSYVDTVDTVDVVDLIADAKQVLLSEQTQRKDEEAAHELVDLANKLGAISAGSGLKAPYPASLQQSPSCSELLPGLATLLRIQLERATTLNQLSEAASSLKREKSFANQARESKEAGGWHLRRAATVLELSDAAEEAGRARDQTIKMAVDCLNQTAHGVEQLVTSLPEVQNGMKPAERLSVEARRLEATTKALQADAYSSASKTQQAMLESDGFSLDSGTPLSTAIQRLIQATSDVSTKQFKAVAAVGDRANDVARAAEDRSVLATSNRDLWNRLTLMRTERNSIAGDIAALEVATETVQRAAELRAAAESATTTPSTSPQITPSSSADGLPVQSPAQAQEDATASKYSAQVADATTKVKGLITTLESAILDLQRTTVETIKNTVKEAEGSYQGIRDKLKPLASQKSMAVEEASRLSGEIDTVHNSVEGALRQLTKAEDALIVVPRNRAAVDWTPTLLVPSEERRSPFEGGATLQSHLVAMKSAKKHVQKLLDSATRQETRKQQAATAEEARIQRGKNAREAAETRKPEKPMTTSRVSSGRGQGSRPIGAVGGQTRPDTEKAWESPGNRPTTANMTKKQQVKGKTAPTTAPANPSQDNPLVDLGDTSASAMTGARAQHGIGGTDIGVPVEPRTLSRTRDDDEL
jgi:hypothetical protein